MSNTTASPKVLVEGTIIPRLEADVKKAISLGTSHFIMLALIFASLLGVNYLYVSRRAEVADVKAAAAEAAAKKEDTTNAAFQAATKQEVSELKQQNVALATQVGALATAIAQRDTAFAGRSAEIKTLPPTVLATQWGSAANEPAPVVSADGTFVTPMPLAQKSLTALENVPVLQKDKADLLLSLSDQTQATKNSDSALGKEQLAHVSDNNACKSDKLALTSQISKVKADARRSKIRSFLFGLGTGAGLALRFL